MKNILLFTLMFVASTSFAKNVTTSFKVDGTCDMCKTTIEKALDVPGVSFAEWDVDSKMLTVRYNTKKINEDKIHSIISNVGYSTDKVEANTGAQKKLDKCCQPGKKDGCASDGCEKH